MNSHPQSRSSSAAFTLIELLTVITIIAILMGLLFPAINIAKDQANKAKAKADIAGVCAAVKAYYTEYGKYPLGDQTPTGTPSDVIFGDTGPSNHFLFDILTNVQSSPGVPNQYNPRAIVFYEGRTASDAAAPKGGLAPKGSTNPGALMDPWGSEYRIAIDADYDNQIIILPYTDFTGATTGPRAGVAVYSLGKDKLLGTKGDNQYRNAAKNANSDDIISWQ